MYTFWATRRVVPLMLRIYARTKSKRLEIKANEKTITFSFPLKLVKKKIVRTQGFSNCIYIYMSIYRTKRASGFSLRNAYNLVYGQVKSLYERIWGGVKICNMCTFMNWCCKCECLFWFVNQQKWRKLIFFFCHMIWIDAGLCHP